MMRGLNLRSVRRALAHSRGMRLVVGLLALSLLLPPQLGFAAELNYARGGGKYR
jgi:hypothetical protein